MSQLSQSAVMAALSTVMDPELHQDLVSLGMVKSVAVQGQAVAIEITLTTPACPLRATIEAEVRSALEPLGADRIDLRFGANVRQAAKSDLPGVKHVVAVGSGKGGVGKSAVSANLAIALSALGASVGLLDADIYGPSIAQMMGLPEAKIVANAERKMVPLERFGIRFLSMANLVPPGQALVWRGPMLHTAVRQFLNDAAWGELDYLLVDLPPGTGDVQLSLSQATEVRGAVVVTTPQDVALIDAARAVDMFHKSHVPLLGMVENMSYFLAPDTGRRYEIFGHGGGRAEAERLKIFFLGEIPLDPALRESGDGGEPLVWSQPEHPTARALREVARALAGRISVETMHLLPMV